MQVSQNSHQIPPLSIVYGEYSENTGFRTRIELIKNLLVANFGSAGDWLVFERGITKKSVSDQGDSRLVQYPRTRSARSLVKNFLLTRYGVTTAELDKKYGLIVAHHFNSIFVANSLKRRLGLPVLLDMHGLWLEEMVSWAAGQPGLKARLFQKIEEAMLASADGLIYVSGSLRDRLVNRYPALSHKPAMVLPCLPDLELFRLDLEARKQLRDEWGWQNCVVLVHSGVNAPWVDIEGIRHLLRLGASIPELRFLFLSSQPEEWGKIADGLLERERVKILSVKHRQMYRFLSAADVGLIARTSSPINQTASPTKIPEYLVTGLPVLMSVGIGDYDALIGQNNLGQSLPRLAALSTEQFQQVLNSLKKIDRDAVSRWATHNLSLGESRAEFSRLCLEIVGSGRGSLLT